MNKLKNFIINVVSQKEGTFIKGMPVKSSYIFAYLSICLFGILIAIAIFLCEFYIENYLSYGFLFGFIGAFVLFSIPAFILIFYNYQINKSRKAILADERLTELKVIPYKIYTLDSNKKNGFMLEIKFEYEGKVIALRTKKYVGKDSIIKPNNEIRILYSPKFCDAIICL